MHSVEYTLSMSKLLTLFILLAVVATACSSTDAGTASSDAEIGDAGVGDSEDSTQAESASEPAEVGAFEFDVPVGQAIDFGPAPEVPVGSVAPELADALQLITSTDIDETIFTDEQLAAIDTIGNSGDPRFVWVFLDILRFSNNPTRITAMTDNASILLGEEFTFADFGAIADRMIAWDIPEPPGYLDAKRAIYSSILIDWEPFFDPDGEVDWRLVSWGGVRIDDQPYDETPGTTCNCIPAVDNPETQPADDADWLSDDTVIFGVEINGQARAYPRQIMEVREMVNDTLGGRDFAMPYCTLCGAAQVFFTDTDNLEGFDRPILRTSGLLTRSNKVMYELNTNSVFDTFLGTALTGPLHDAGIQLEQHTVVTSTWGDWVAEHPDTDVLVEELALGRDFDFRSGRDADGPIFPIGDVDPRLDVQEDVLGIVADDGTPIAFHVNSAIAALDAGRTIEVGGVNIVRSGSGIAAVDADGNELTSHQAFWFAWSQFYPGTDVWTADDVVS